MTTASSYEKYAELSEKLLKSNTLSGQKSGWTKLKDLQKTKKHGCVKMERLFRSTENITSGQEGASVSQVVPAEFFASADALAFSNVTDCGTSG